MLPTYISNWTNPFLVSLISAPCYGLLPNLSLSLFSSLFADLSNWIWCLKLIRLFGCSFGLGFVPGLVSLLFCVVYEASDVCFLFWELRIYTRILVYAALHLGTCASASNWMWICFCSILLLGLIPYIFSTVPIAELPFGWFSCCI